MSTLSELKMRAGQRARVLGATSRPSPSSELQKLRQHDELECYEETEDQVVQVTF